MQVNIEHQYTTFSHLYVLLVQTTKLQYTVAVLFSLHSLNDFQLNGHMQYTCVSSPQHFYLLVTSNCLFSLFGAC